LRVALGIFSNAVLAGAKTVMPFALLSESTRLAFFTAVTSVDVRREALLFRMEVKDRHRPAVVAVGCSWRQPEPGVAGEGGSSLDKVGSAEHCRMGRAR
jgi:hypothetical protein